MTHSEFISLVREPEKVHVEHLNDLKEMCELYPYFVQPRMLLAKAFKLSNSIHFEANLKLAALYSSNRRALYYYIYPEKKLSTDHYRSDQSRKSSGDYFDMIDKIEQDGGDTKQSLKLLAEKLKSAREIVLNPQIHSQKQENKINRKPILKNENFSQPILNENVTVKNDSEDSKVEISESSAKLLIKNKKYSEAIEILSKLNLNNPKKSVYFADQIRFLEKVISNSKK